MTETKELRAAGAADLTFKRAPGAPDDAPEGVKVAGYAAVFNEWADIGGFFQERIAPGAFDGRLGDDVRFLINHRDLPLARVSSGTLALSLDDHGLRMETHLDPSDPDAARIIPKMRRGDMREMSFAFTVAKEEWDETGDIPRRTITEIGQLIDVAIVTTPAYAGTEIGLRSLDAHRAAQAGPENSPPERARRMRMRLTLTGQA